MPITVDEARSLLTKTRSVSPSVAPDDVGTSSSVTLNEAVALTMKHRPIRTAISRVLPSAVDTAQGAAGVVSGLLEPVLPAFREPIRALRRASVVPTDRLGPVDLTQLPETARRDLSVMGQDLNLINKYLETRFAVPVLMEGFLAGAVEAVQRGEPQHALLGAVSGVAKRLGQYFRPDKIAAPTYSDLYANALESQTGKRYPVLSTVLGAATFALLGYAGAALRQRFTKAQYDALVQETAEAFKLPVEQAERSLGSVLVRRAGRFRKVPEGGEAEVFYELDPIKLFLMRRRLQTAQRPDVTFGAPPEPAISQAPPPTALAAPTVEPAPAAPSVAPRPVRPPRPAVPATFTDSTDPRLLDYLVRSGLEPQRVAGLPPAERLRLGNDANALRDAVIAQRAPSVTTAEPPEAQAPLVTRPPTPEATAVRTPTSALPATTGIVPPPGPAQPTTILPAPPEPPPTAAPAPPLRPPAAPKPKPRSLIGIVRARGGLDPEKLKKDYYLTEDIRQFGLTSVLKTGGRGLDEMAASLQEEGLLTVPPERSPGDYLLEVLKDREKRIIKTADQLEDEYEREYAQFLERERALHPDEQLTPDEIAAVERDIQKEIQGEAATRFLEAAESSEGVAAPAAPAPQTQPTAAVIPPVTLPEASTTKQPWDMTQSELSSLSAHEKLQAGRQWISKLESEGKEPPPSAFFLMTTAEARSEGLSEVNFDVLKESIQKAVDLGLPVPSAVLADFPNIQKKQHVLAEGVASFPVAEPPAGQRPAIGEPLQLEKRTTLTPFAAALLRDALQTQGDPLIFQVDERTRPAYVELVNKGFAVVERMRSDDPTVIDAVRIVRTPGRVRGTTFIAEGKGKPMHVGEPLPKTPTGYATAGGFRQELPQEPGEFSDVSLVLGGLDRVKPLEMPEITKLAATLMLKYPTLKKFPAALGKFYSNFGTIKLHPWLFVGPETVERFKAILRDAQQGAITPSEPTPEMIELGIRRLTPALLRKMEFAVTHLSGQGYTLGPKVLAHEIGHLIDWLPDRHLKRGNLIGRAIASVRQFLKGTFSTEDGATLKNATFRTELKALTQYWKPFDELRVMMIKPKYVQYRYSAPELYADFISVLLNAPDKAKELAPTFYRAFFDYLDRKPEVKQSFTELQDLLQHGSESDLLRSREQDIAQMFRTGEQTFRAKRLQHQAAQKSLFFRLRLLFWDQNWPMLVKRNAVAKQTKINPEHDPKFLLEEWSYTASIAKSYLEPYARVYRVVQEEGFDFDQDFGAYLFLTRVVGERKDIANPLGHTPFTAQRQLDFMKQRLGDERFKRLEALVGQARDWMQHTINPLAAEDLLTETQARQIAQNDFYAPFQVLKYLKEWVPAGIIPQQGTLEPIANPGVSLAFKGVSIVYAATRNRIKKLNAHFLMQHFPDEVKVATITHQPGHPMHVETPPEGMGTIVWKERGRWKALHVDAFIADSLAYDRTGTLAWMSHTLNQLFGNNAVFRPLFITYNLGFQSVNILRDFLRTWKTTPGLTLSKALARYAEAIPPSVRRVKGVFDPLIQQMQREAALNITYNDFITGQTGDEQELEAILDRYGMLPPSQGAIGVLKPVAKWLSVIKTLGDVIETVPKVAGYRHLQDVDQLSAPERAYFVRNFVGTPNWKRRGSAFGLYNNVFLFSNVFKEGWRGDWEAAFKQPRTRSGYWWKTLKLNMLPKALMIAGAIGLLGKAVKDSLDGQSEYTKSSYQIVPLGQDERGQSVALAVPQDETGRVLGAVFWKSFQLARGEQDPADVAKYLAGQLPQPTPLIELASNWVEFLTGRTPRDWYRGHDILTKDELAAGGWEALEPMVRWTLNQAGVFHFDIRDRLKDETLLEQAVALTPVANRFIRISAHGVEESLRREAERVERQEAHERLATRARIRQELRAGRTPQQVARGIAEAAERSQVERMARRELLRAQDEPVVDALTSATSNAQRVAILHRLWQDGRFATRADYRKFLREMVRQRVVSDEVEHMALRTETQEALR